jgi:hypothetical protein
MIENKITTYGVHSATHTVYWYEMGRYWVTKKYGHYLLNIEYARFPYKMLLLFDEKEKAQIQKLLDKYLVEETPEPSAFDKAADWLDKRVPLDREEKVTQSKAPLPTQEKPAA